MLFDSDVVIWAIRGRQDAAKAIDAAEYRGISAVTYMELVKGAKNKEDLKWIKSYIHDLGIAIIPVENMPPKSTGILSGSLCSRATITRSLEFIFISFMIFSLLKLSAAVRI